MSQSNGVFVLGQGDVEAGAGGASALGGGYGHLSAFRSSNGGLRMP
jgi:hypothetical protein